MSKTAPQVDFEPPDAAPPRDPKWSFRMSVPKPPDHDIQKAKWLGWKIGSILLVGPVYMVLIKEAWMLLFPVLGKPLLLGLNGALILSVGLCLFVWYAWERAILAWLGVDVPAPIPGMDSEADKKLINWMAIALIVADSGLMYIAMTRLGWRGAVFSFPAILATVCWLSVLMFISYVSARLRMPLLRD